MKIQSINPATERVLEEYDLISSKEAFEVLEKADKAFMDWRDVKLHNKSDLMRSLAEVLRDNIDKYSTMMTREMGKPISQARAEVEKCAWAAEVYADNVQSWIREETVEADGKEHRVIFQPLGVILSIMPWNFPLWQVYRFAIPTLLVGNTAILKHSNDVPGCALLVEESFQEAGFPEHVFSTIIADHRVTEELIASPKIQGVSLTGSTSAGAHIAKIAGKHLKKVVLELGGSDPFIVFDDVDMEKVLDGALIGRCQNNGQSCIAAKRFIVHEDIIDEFADKFGDRMAEQKIGDPLEPDTDIGPLANQKQLDEIYKQLNDAVNSGGKLLTGGQKVKDTGYFFPPSVVTDVTDEMRIYSEEVFGPLAAVIPFSTEEEAIRIANDSEFGLGGSVWTKDLAKGERIARSIEAGSVFVNNIVKSDPRMPFGGIKKSGIGRELSEYGLKEFVNTKGLNIYDL